MRAAGIDPRSTSLEIGIFGAEPWTGRCAQEIEARLGHRRGRHLWPLRDHGAGRRQRMRRDQGRPDDLGGSFLSRDHRSRRPAQVLPDGEEGELVFTTLTKEALPMIRYRTRDLTRLLPPTARSMRRMDKITGRSDDMLIIRGVNVFPTQVEELILKMPDAGAELSARGHAARATWTSSRCMSRMRPECRGDARMSPRSRGEGTAAPYQDACRRSARASAWSHAGRASPARWARRSASSTSGRAIDHERE